MSACISRIAVSFHQSLCTQSKSATREARHLVDRPEITVQTAEENPFLVFPYTEAGVARLGGDDMLDGGTDQARPCDQSMR